MLTLRSELMSLLAKGIELQSAVNNVVPGKPCNICNFVAARFCEVLRDIIKKIGTTIKEYNLTAATGGFRKIRRN